VLQHQANFTSFRDLCQHREAGFSGRNRIHLLSLGWMEAYLNSLSVSSMERRGEWIYACGASTAQKREIRCYYFSRHRFISASKGTCLDTRFIINAAAFSAVRSADRLGFSTT